MVKECFDDFRGVYNDLKSPILLCLWLYVERESVSLICFSRWHVSPDPRKPQRKALLALVLLAIAQCLLGARRGRSI